MAAPKKTKKEMSGAQKMGIGVGLTAAAVAAAGAYFLYGSAEAPKNRKKVKSWALKAKADVLEALEKAEHITESEYKAIVDTVGGAYGKVRNASATEVTDFKKEMKNHWGKIQKSGVMQTVSVAAKKLGGTAPKKSAPKKTAAKKTVKKSAAKSASK